MRYGTELIRDLVKRFGDNQIIILTSDHGQLFGEHGFIGHGTVIYDEVDESATSRDNAKAVQQKRKGKGYQSLVNIPRVHQAAACRRHRRAFEADQRQRMRRDIQHTRKHSERQGVDKRKMAKFDKYQKRIFK